MKIPKRLIAAFAGLDREAYLSFAALTGQFFSGWPEGTEAQKQSFQLLRETADLVDALLVAERTELSPAELKLFNRRELTQAVKLLRESIIEVYDRDTDSQRSFGAGDSVESVYQSILEFLDQFESCFVDADAIELPQWRSYWLGEDPGLQQVKLTAASIPAAYHSKEGRDGIFADFDSTGALVRLGCYRSGRLSGPQLEIDVEKQSAAVSEVTEFPDQQAALLSKDDPDYSVEFYDWLEDKIETICSQYYWAGAAAAEARCSLCRKKESDVDKLYAGPRATVCSDCLALCQDILSEESLDL